MTLSADAVLTSYEGIKIQGIEENRRLLQSDPAPFESTAVELADFMYSRKLLKNKLTVDNFIDGFFLPTDTP